MSRDSGGGELGGWRGRSPGCLYGLGGKVRRGGMFAAVLLMCLWMRWHLVLTSSSSASTPTLQQICSCDFVDEMNER